MPSSPKKFTYIDLFAGCGGLSWGLSKAGWKGLLAIEKSEDAFLTLNHNLIKENKHYSWPTWLPCKAHDINVVLNTYKTNLEGLKGTIDLVSGGPPCQGFSTAGRRKENDVRNGLIKSYIKFISLVQPKLIFFENVKGFTQKFGKNKSKGITYSDFVVESLKKIGYSVEGQMIDFSKYGLPQKRTRFILVGIRNDICKTIDSKKPASIFFKILKNQKEGFLSEKGLASKPTLGQAISDLLSSHGIVVSPDSKNFNAGTYSPSKSKYQEFMRSSVVDDKVDSHRFANHKESTVEKFETLLATAPKNKNLPKALKKKLNINKHTVIPLDSSKATPTLTTLPDDYIHYREPRILTVREYARIQSFPDNFQFKGKYTTGGLRRTKEVPRYSQVGNAIPPLFGEQTGQALIKLLNAAF